MPADFKLSDHCLVNHWDRAVRDGPQAKVTPLSLMWKALNFVDRKMYFTGLRGATWRILGVDRSVKNPNPCNS
jgi:hypothetical protein